MPVRFRRALVGRYLSEGIVRWFCFVCALISVLTTFGILYVLISQSIPFFRNVSPVDFFTGSVWSPTPEPGKFGVLPLVAGTLMITVGAGVFAIPMGLLSAVFLSEYASPRVRNVLKPALELLAGIPTVVYGYFGLFFVTPLLRRFVPDIQSSNVTSGAIVVGIMILPLVSSLCEDAISAVPRSLREGAYGLGATKAEVTGKIVLPAALSGIMASFILALSRALGETMAVTLAAGANPALTFNPARAIETMTAYIVETTKGDAEVGTVRYNSIFAVGITLFVVTMVMNLVAARLVKKFRQVYSWA
ncbi:MAG: phosphate ABC transporter permease subunit PstC [Fimbriimonas sp.]|nr:phosphate ABC transporter permease subunit PstC [Fimbriimonas sp.]